jgi:hypothetical protein
MMSTTPTPAEGALTGRRAQACDAGKCEPITIMTEPQRAADGSWEVLVMFDSRPDYLTPLKVPGYLYLKAPSTPAGQAPAPAVTEAMVTAYLHANDAYWKRTDELPTPPDKWRTGTPREATRVSLEAALATPQPAQEPSVAFDCQTGHECSFVSECEKWCGNPHCRAQPAQEPADDAARVSLAHRIEELAEQHGSLRAAASALDVDVGYLSRLRSGLKDAPSDELLSRLGLERFTEYRRAALEEQPAMRAERPKRCPNANDEQCRAPDCNCGAEPCTPFESARRV